MTRDEAKAAIKQGQYQTRTVCVLPCDISSPKANAKEPRPVSTVLAFPHGVSRTETKVAEAETFARLGIAEVDMVANYGFVKAKLVGL